MFQKNVKLSENEYELGFGFSVSHSDIETFDSKVKYHLIQAVANF